MKLIRYIFSFIVFTLCQFAFSQSNIEFDELSGDNISTQSITYAIKQDSIGNIWIASEEGVMKYNSKQIKLYNTYGGLPETINNRISTLFIDSNNRVWIGLENGVCLYDAILDKFDLIKSEIDITPSLVNSISEDSYGNIWIAGFNGLWKINNDLKLDKKENSTNIKALCFKKDNIIFGNQKGLFKYNMVADVVTEIEPEANLKNIWFLGYINSKIHIGLKTGEIYTVDENLTQVSEVSISKKNVKTGIYLLNIFNDKNESITKKIVKN